jgi:hypothetical protein
VPHELLIDFDQALEDSFVGGHLFAQADEGTDQVDAHFDGLGAAEDVGGHEDAVFGEGPGMASSSSMIDFI